MRFVYFTHSLASCWNHGNAHFQRGVLRALIEAGHEAVAYEPRESWSRSNLLAEHGPSACDGFAASFPDLPLHFYDDAHGAEAAVQNADVVIVHEWTDPAIVASLGRLRRAHGRFTLMFHDTHHRAVSDPDAMRAFDLSGYDGVLAFGAALADIYTRWGWGGRVFIWHEAADTTLFHPPAGDIAREGAVWIGNWGDGERTAELGEYLLQPAMRAGVTLDIHGVRYPPEALAMLTAAGARYHGWIANTRVPAIFARHAMTVHVPRRHYTAMLPGIPTIRVFEALACGIPLICAPWDDAENLFRPGEDYLVARNGAEMEMHMATLSNDTARGAALAASGLARIRARHSCTIRARELLDIVDSMSVQAGAA